MLQFGMVGTGKAGVVFENHAQREKQMGTTKVWRGFLGFGLLNMPVYLTVGARERRVELHEYHVACNGPAKRPQFCPACDVMLQPSEVFKGFEGPRGIVPLEKEAIEELKPATEKQINIRHCVPWSSVDPVWLAENFYLVPEDAGKRAYSLVNRVLTETNTAAIGQLTKSGREHVILIRPKNTGLMVHFIWYSDELASVPEFDLLESERFSVNEIKLATQLVESLKSPFHPEEFDDGYRQRLNTLIASKLDKTVSPPPSVKVPQQNASADITEALMASLAVGKKPAQTVEKKTAKKGKRAAA